MNIREKIHQLIKRPRRGSALIITLGILGLLLIICMVFAFDARSQRKAAFNHAASIRSRLINESGFKRATGILDDILGDITDDNTFLNPASKFYSGTGTWAGTKYLPTLVSPVSNSVDSLTNEAYATIFSTGSASMIYTDSDFSSGVAVTPTWATIESDSIIGNYTYLIIDKTGQLPPGYMKTANPASYTELKGTIADLDLSVAGVIAANYIVDTATCFGIADYFRNGQSLAQNKVLSLVCPGMVPEEEVFWHYRWDADGGSLGCFDTEIFKRMDITQVGNGIGAEEVFRFLVTSDSTADANLVTDSRKSLWIQGLDEYGEKPAAAPVAYKPIDADAARWIAAQLALNMVDSADADNNASVATIKGGQIAFPTNGDLSTFDPAAEKAATSPDAIIYGVEPAILENVSVFVDFTSTAGAGATMTANGTVTVDLSVYSPMKETLTAPTARIQMYYNIGGANDTPSPVLTVTNVSAYHSTFTGSFTFTGASAPAGVCTVTGIEIRALEVSNNGGICRKYPMFSRGATDSYTTFMTISGVCSDVATKDLQYLAQVRGSLDPFFYERDIMSTDFNVLWEEKIENGTYILKENTPKTAMVAPSFYYDTQDYSDAKCPNTAFTRIGELGRIHSTHHDKKSIRFWNQDNTDATHGDWHDAYLLDMFKAGTESEARKININTPSDSVATTFVELVQLSNATPLLTAGESANLVDNLLEETAYRPFMYRGDIYNAFDKNHPVGTTVTVETDIKNDRRVEQAISTFIELLGTRQNYYHIIAASRSVKELGDISAIPQATRNKMGAVEIAANNYGIVEAKYKTITEVYRDAWKRESKVLRINVLEE